MKILPALIAAAIPTLASAVTTSVDYSDMWWNPNESGWGANMIQQGDTIFVTLFVYDQNGNPTWFVAPSTTATGATHFAGPLFKVTGPYYGASSFNAAGVTATQVGNLTFDAKDASDATLAYSVNGVNVTKSVQRQTWRTENLAGSYRGATIGTFTGCGAGGASPVDNATTITITQNVNNVTLNEFGTGYTCRYTGTLIQTGKVGSITGLGTCSDGTTQNFTMSNIQTGPDFVSMGMTADIGQCHFSGRFGGMRQN